MPDLSCFISLIVKAVAEGFFDAVAVDVATAGDAPGADAEEDLDAVAGPSGDLGGFYASVEAGGQTGLAQGIVRAAGYGRLHECKCEGKVAGVLPGVAVKGCQWCSVRISRHPFAARVATGQVTR